MLEILRGMVWKMKTGEMLKIESWSQVFLGGQGGGGVSNLKLFPIWGFFLHVKSIPQKRGDGEKKKLQ